MGGYLFTLPHKLNEWILRSERNYRALVNLLFKAAAETLQQFGSDQFGGKLGITMVLHTWDQRLVLGCQIFGIDRQSG